MGVCLDVQLVRAWAKAIGPTRRLARTPWLWQTEVLGSCHLPRAQATVDSTSL